MLKKKLILISILLGLGIVMTGCSNPNTENIFDDSARFKIIYSQTNHSDYADDSIQIIKDTQTGQEYLWRKRGYSGGLVPLQQSNKQ